MALAVSRPTPRMNDALSMVHGCDVRLGTERRSCKGEPGATSETGRKGSSDGKPSGVESQAWSSVPENDGGVGAHGLPPAAVVDDGAFRSGLVGGGIGGQEGGSEDVLDGHGVPWEEKDG